MADPRRPGARHEALGLADGRPAQDVTVTCYSHRRVDERSWILNRQGKAAFVISCQGHEGGPGGRRV